MIFDAGNRFLVEISWEPFGLGWIFGNKSGELGAISVEKIYRLIDGKNNVGLRPCCDQRSGCLNSGDDAAIFSAGSLVLEFNLAFQFCHSLPTSAGQEDHNANSWWRRDLPAKLQRTPPHSWQPNCLPLPEGLI